MNFFRLPVAATTFLLGVAASLAQPSPSATPAASPSPTPFVPQELENMKRIQEAALQSDYAYRQVAHLSNNIGPRLTGSAQAQKAVEYVAGELKALGLEVQLEKVTVPHWVRGEESAVLTQFFGQAENTTQKIVLTALGGSVPTPPDGLTADVISVRTFDELNVLGRDKITGKIVLFDHAFDKQMAAEGRGGEAYGDAVAYRSDAPSAAARMGAAATLIRSVGGAEYRLPHTGQTNYAKDAPQIPAAAVTAEDADLISALSAQGAVRMRLVLTPKTLPDATSYNVIGDLKGREHPDEIVIVSGHLDSWDLGTGAIDDGAGVAISMQAANIVHELHLQPRRTLRVLAWMNEENGLAGGNTYALDHAADAGKHFAAFETDGGAGHPVGLNYNGKPALKALLGPIAKVLEASGAGLLSTTDHAGADIAPLALAGVPTFSPMQDSRFYFNYHHTAADTLDKIVPRELAENAAVVAVAAYALAEIEEPLPR
ncbi:MAG TPA: M20/M25/M40 family metallo-hydrolase [Chthoniobacterales bacterium]|nr:M20/M25/M40 family metallo-hydrolase [Chthoniobacterales bacterium]